MNLGKILRSTATFVAALMLCSSVQAQLFRAYLASDGSDANPCTLQQPCRLLPAALNAIADGGEIWMLDSANFNTGQVNVTKSVTILAIPGALGSVVATGAGEGININTPGVKVTLRNLVIVHLTSSSHGINFVQGAQLNVAECEIANIQGSGIYATAANSKVTVKNTVLRGTGNSVGFFSSGTVVASLDGVHSKGHLYGMQAFNGPRVAISNSVFSGNLYGVVATTASGGSVRLVLERSVVTGNSNGIHAQSNSAGELVEVTASHNAVTHNTTAGFYASQVASSTVHVISDGNTVTENAIGFQFAFGTPTIYTRSNNTVKFNGMDLSGGTLTVLAAQ